jgi:hypothetical protein
MVTADQLVCHAVGDYVLQSDWMANNKTKRSLAALAHVLTYVVPFLFLRPSVVAMVVIVATHFVIDRWRLARYVCYVKNQVLSPEMEQSWSECSDTGYHRDRPPWMAVWLMIIADNVMHILINGLALEYLR